MFNMIFVLRVAMTTRTCMFVLSISSVSLADDMRSVDTTNRCCIVM